MRRCLAMGLLGALSLIASTASAQPTPASAQSTLGAASAGDPPPGPGVAMMPPLTRLQLTPLFGEPTGPGGSLAPPIAVLPLRLSLFGDVFPYGHLMPGDACGASEVAAGNSFAGFAVQRQAYLPLASRFTFHAFSRAGCALDAVGGAGLTYALPLPKDMWLVASAGMTTQQVSSGRSVLRNDARLDFVIDGSSKRPFAVGIGRRGLTFSGLW